MKVDEVCKPRMIKSLDVKTPLLVPSFSSKGFPDLSRMYDDLREQITDSSLVSAYDVKYEVLAESDIYSSQVVFIDSGGYETGKNEDMGDLYVEHLTAKKTWTREMHLEFMQTLKPTCPAVAVSYDEKLPLKDQIRHAKEFFRSLPDWGSDFLVKPTDDESDTIPVQELCRNIKELRNFDVLGITEKELGASFFDRCSNLVTIRKAMLSAELDRPIHIFGCLDPLSVYAYFLCGADVFDGLSWLKYGYDQYCAIYHLNYSIVRGAWKRSQKAIRKWMPVQNLIYLSKTQTQMARYTTTRDLTTLGLQESQLKELTDLTEAAGVFF